MSNTKPFLGKATSNPSEAFPDVISLSLKITQDPSGWYSEREGANVRHMTLNSLSRSVGCLNKRCQQGGLDLQNIIMFYESGTFDFCCDGHEGSPAGRNKGDPCDNRFTVELEISRKKR
ncbi:hypothetical protein KW834_03385 [Pseudomonas sp. PDM29]|jgi:hypothetical protein|uniref:hypothetical protein n=1 Tax=Pseudomonas sp. PDM29 TaxID=2854771 RepID=UPI001C48EA9E|nr:hypothetical protein [Pseudomonas sp. PDM29]MBV7523449.1 hypothetical protein [Pseudomonas sp. PDM29]